MQAKNVWTTPQKILRMSQIPIPHLKTWTFCLCVGVFLNVCYAEKWVWVGGEEVANNNEKGKMKIILYSYYQTNFI